MRDEPRARGEVQRAVSGGAHHRGPRRGAVGPHGRRRLDRDTAGDALPARQACARGRQARARREAAGHVRRSGRGARGARGEPGIDAHARAHLPLQPRGQQGPGAHRLGRAGRDLLRHLVAHEPRHLPARRGGQRPRAARSVDLALLDRSAGHDGRRLRLDGVPERRARDRVPHPVLRSGADRQRAAVVAGSAQGAPDDRGRQQADGRLRRRRDGRRRPDLRPRVRLHRAEGLRRVSAHLPLR